LARSNSNKHSTSFWLFDHRYLLQQSRIGTRLKNG
jgi:hypothetical protein